MAQGTEAAQPEISPRSSITQLQRAMASGRVSAEALVRGSLRRIDALDRHGPALNAVLRLNPRALEEARALDRERRAGHIRGPLHGVAVLVKDNIETADPIPTTAGSLALAKNYARRDAPVVAALRSAGAIILGKTNLSEWANYRSTHATSGWSAVGGLTRNPYVLDRTACGSSSGSAVAVAAGFVPAALGTETDGSVTCPAAMNGIVGLKPTLGLLSQQGIVPISHSQDSAGPMARSVADVALLLSAMTGHDYARGLGSDALRGKRLGVLRFDPGKYPATDLVYAHALATLRTAGAVLIDVKPPDMDAIGNAEQQVLQHEFKTDMDAYLARTPKAVATRTLSALIAFDYASPDELRFFGQELFVQAEISGATGDAAYRAALERAKRLAGKDGIDRLLHEQQLDALIAPTSTPAWRVDIIYGDANTDAFTTLPAVAGYPHLTVPMGQVDGLPVGLSFIASAHQEALLLAMGAR
jgi:amidase